MWDELAKSPRFRLAVTLSLTIIIGVLSSVLASQIMPQGTLDWSLLPRVSSFWILFLFAGFWIFVHLQFLHYDESVMNFADDEHCRAHIRKTQLEGIAMMVKSNPTKAGLINVKDILKGLEVKEK